MKSSPQSNLERLRKILLVDDFITSDKFLNNSGENYVYFKRDFLFRSGNWRGAEVSSIWRNRALVIEKNLVTGHADLHTSSKHLFLLEQLKVKRIFGSNTINKSGFSESVPLGLTNDCDDSPVHRILGNTNHIREADQASHAPLEFDGSIYLNFNLRNNLVKRREVTLALRDNSNVDSEKIDLSDSGRIRYLAKLRSASLVPCPEGNGIDTHRLWETIYMGGTPVILRNEYLPTVLNELPVIQLDSWSLLNDSDRMEALWYQVRDREYNFESLTASYWIARMTNV
jgi:hypothetical protein